MKYALDACRFVECGDDDKRAKTIHDSGKQTSDRIDYQALVAVVEFSYIQNPEKVVSVDQVGRFGEVGQGLL